MKGTRTYWHLHNRGKLPSSYEITSERLLYHAARGFAVPTPVSRWHERHQLGSKLRASFEDFSDPRATTYASYVKLQSEQEAFLDELSRSIDETGYDAQLDPRWLSVLDAVLPVARYPVHALHMLAAYVAQLAPEGKVVIAGAFQSADEMRRIQRLAQRMFQLGQTHEGFGASARQAWQERAEWQPLRALLERLLVTYDFGQALIALQLVVKPLFDRLFMAGLAERAAQSGDRLLCEMLLSLDRDCRWHRQWSSALVRVALSEAIEHRDVIVDWIRGWWPDARAAFAACAPLFGWSPELAAAKLLELAEHCRDDWRACGLKLGDEGEAAA